VSYSEVSQPDNFIIVGCRVEPVVAIAWTKILVQGYSHLHRFTQRGFTPFGM